MHKNINFSELAGLPFDQQTLEFMQSAYSELSGCLAAMIGDNVIVAGCIVSGNSVSAGWIITGGQLLPFAASETGVLETFIIQESIASLIFENAQQKQIEFSRFAQFGTNDKAIRWDSLTRLPSLASMADSLSKHLSNQDNPHKVTKAQVGLSNIPNAISDSTTLVSSTTLATSKAVNAVLKEVTKLSEKFTYKRYVLSTNPGTGIYEGKLDSGFSLYTGIFADFGTSRPYMGIGWVWYENGDIKYKFEKRNADSSGNYYIDVLYVTQ
ncbi:MAG: hypothetical protein LBQ74_03940 [Prevotella sp.]|jgi:hypothetical protein|nr:hypothetical protein [Prevotella sp.]